MLRSLRGASATCNIHMKSTHEQWANPKPSTASLLSARPRDVQMVTKDKALKIYKKQQTQPLCNAAEKAKTNQTHTDERAQILWLRLKAKVMI